MRVRRLLRNIETPPDLARAVELTCQLHRLRTPLAKARAEEELKLRYYYGGRSVLCLKTSEGLVVVAAGRPGTGQLRKALESLAADERRRAIVCSPDPWDERDFTPVSSAEL